jgi:hypothetical protein
MKTGLKYSLFTIALSVAFAGAAQAEDHWVKDPDTDCMIWSPDPIEPDTKVSWSGACQGTGKGGPAYGVGKLVWTEGGVEIGVYEGGLSGGKLSNSGELKIREKADDKFTVARGVFAEGALNGYGEVDSPDGGTYRGALMMANMKARVFWSTRQAIDTKASSKMASLMELASTPERTERNTKAITSPASQMVSGFR